MKNDVPVRTVLAFRIRIRHPLPLVSASSISLSVITAGTIRLEFSKRKTTEYFQAIVCTGSAPIHWVSGVHAKKGGNHRWVPRWFTPSPYLERLAPFSPQSSQTSRLAIFVVNDSLGKRQRRASTSLGKRDHITEADTGRFIRTLQCTCADTNVARALFVVPSSLSNSARR